MLRNKNEEPAQPSSPQSPGEQSKSVDKEVSYREGSDKDMIMLGSRKLPIQIIIKSLVRVRLNLLCPVELKLGSRGDYR